MIQTGTGRDLTNAMEQFCDRFFGALDPASVDGFMLKSRSPSCALTDAKIYAAVVAETPIGTGPGLFGATLLRRFPAIPAFDENDLADPEKRNRFLHHLGKKSR